jgi:hypothetical protein
MTDTKPDLKPNERKVLDSLLALGEATAAKVGEHAGLAYPTTTPKLRKLETLGLAEKFNNDASQTLWRAASTNAAAGNNDGTDEAAQATSPATDEPGHPGESGTAEADGAAPHEAAPTAPDPDETVPPTPATPAAAGPAGQPEAAEPEESGDDAPAGEDATAPANAAEPEAAEPEAAEPEAAEPEAAEPEAAGDDAPAGEDATAPPDAPAPKAKRKRPAGALEASVLAILRGDPDGQYKVNDLRKLVDKADEATGYPAASAGAIANALDKLTGKGQVASIPAKHATFQAAPAG